MDKKQEQIFRVFLDGALTSICTWEMNGLKRMKEQSERDRKMTATIRFNDGKEVELSEETTKKLRAELVKPEHVWKHGDVGDYNSNIRLFAKAGQELQVIDERGLILSRNAQSWARDFGYKFLGNIFDGTYKP